MSFEEFQQYFDFVDKQYVWIVEIFSIVFVTLLVDYIQKRIIRRVTRQLEKTSNLWDDAFFQAIRRPLSLIIWVVGLSFVLDVVAIEGVGQIINIGVIVAVAWALLRFISFVEKNIIHQNEVIGKTIDKTTSNAISQLLRISVVITASLVGLESMGVNVSAILAFGGIGGIAVGFAAKDLLSNFFGGMMIYLDRPFAIDDWIRSPDKSIEGTVEKIGWRLTVIRTFDKRPLYVPNSVFTTIAVENPSRMTHRRIYETLGVRYEDARVLPQIVADVKQMLIDHPMIDNSQTMIVNFNAFSASSLDFFVYTFTHETNWIRFHEIKQDVLFKISDIVLAHGAEFAYPTSTVHTPDLVEQLPEPARP